MKVIKAIRNIVSRKRHEVRRRNVIYYDNYTMMGSILGGYCGMMKFDGRRENPRLTSR